MTIISTEAMELFTGSSYDVIMLRVGTNLINYVYIITDHATRDTAIIDPAWNLKYINKMIQKFELNPHIILLTHSHADHTNLVEPLIYQYNTKVFMSSIEIDYYKFKCENLYPLNDQDILFLGQTPIKSILTPGHTKGGLCYLLSHSLFTGDTVFIEGCGICNTRGGNPYAMYHSIQKIKCFIKSYVSVFPGHSYGQKPGAQFDYLMKNNIYFQLQDIEMFVKFRMRPNQHFMPL